MRFRIKNEFRLHLGFWSVYFLFCYASDYIVDPTSTLTAEIVFYLSNNIYLFYSLLYFLKKFSWQDRISIIESFCRLFIIIGIYVPVRFLLRYVFLARYVDPEFGVLPIHEWVITTIIWILNYFYVTSAYFYFITSLKKQKTVAELMHMKFLKEKQNLELENSLLRAQINPHFLYNSLNFLYAKSLPVSKELSDAIVKMSDIMRYSMEEQDNNGYVQLSAEVTHIHNLIEMARLRFSNKIFIEFSAPQNLQNIRIIPLVLVTLVENVLKHGQLNDPAQPARIRLRISEDGELQFSTWNRKRSGPKEVSTSIGLKNTIRRLEEAYGRHCEISISDGDDCFTSDIRLSLTSNHSLVPC